ncbi:MAG: Nramp family divalent metal transporter, partial [Nocardioidaceae bacterium]
TTPDPTDLALGFRPTFPDGSLIYLLGVVGGVGMTLGLCSYGYWLRDRGWTGPAWITAMRLDLVVGYLLTFLFMAAMMVVGAEFLNGSGRSIDSEEGLLALAEPFGAEFGSVAKWLLLLGFFSAVYSSLLGGFNALAYIFADIVNIVRGVPQEEDDKAERTWPFRAYLLWVTFPPMILLFVGSPVFLVLLYAAGSAIFTPVMAACLIWLMNSRRLSAEHRNRWLANGCLATAVILFGALGVQQLMIL